MTCNLVVVNIRRAVLISPYDGVVPPSGIPAHSSTLSAPPFWAATQLSTPLAQISNRKSSLFIVSVLFGAKIVQIEYNAKQKLVFCGHC
jgi:hypothetical protein